MTYYSEGEKSAVSPDIARLGQNIISPPKQQQTLTGLAADKAREFGQGRAEDRLRDFAGNKPGVVGIIAGAVVGLAVDKVKADLAQQAGMESEMAGIKGLSEKNIPGFVYKEVEIDGQKYRIGVDASGQVDTPGQSPRVIVERVTQNGFPQDDSVRPMERPPNLKEGELATHISAMKNEASAEAAEFRQNNEAKLYERKEKYAEEIMKYGRAVSKAKPEDAGKIPFPIAYLQYSDLLKEQITEASGSILAEVTREKQPQATPKAMTLTAG